MTWIIIIVILVAWYLSVQKKIEPIRNNENSYIDEAPKFITEEQVFEREKSFNKSLEEEIDFPDAIRGKDIYVYKELMHKWFQKLSSENRYNEDLLQKLRRDWLDYMSLMKEQKTLLFLSMEDIDDAAQYREEESVVAQKLLAIEDAFAAAVGKEAEKELSRVYNLDMHSFDKFGNIAPNGSMYNLSGDLVRKKSN